MKKILFLFILLLSFNKVSAVEIPDIKDHIAKHDPNAEPHLNYKIENCEVNKNKNFFCVYYNSRDFRGRIIFGNISNGKISNTTFELNDLEYVTNIHSARFLDFKHNSLLETHKATNMGNGEIYIYKIEGNSLKELFSADAVDCHHENLARILTPKGELAIINWDDPSKNPEGQVVQVSNSFKDSILSAQYLDLNHDSYEDLILEGFIQSTIENENSKIISQKNVPIKRNFLWDPQKQTFVEDKTKRVGPKDYFNTIDN